MKKLVVILIFLLAVPAWAGYETLNPDGLGNKSEWTPTIDGFTELSDADDGSYISCFLTADTQRVTNADLAQAEGNDRIDSVRLVWRGLRLVSATARAGIGIGTDYLEGASRVLGASATDYTESFTSPPGSRGTWDKVEVDSLVMQFRCSAIGEEGRVLDAYLEVFFTAEQRQIYWMTDTSALGGTCVGSVNGTKDLQVTAWRLDTLKFAIAASSTNLALGFNTAPGNGDWTTAGVSVHFRVIRFTNTPQFQVKIYRFNNSCIEQEATGYFPTAGNLTIDSTGNYVINVSSKNWSSGATTDNFGVGIEFDNAAAQPVDSVYIETGDTTSAVYSEIWYTPGGQGSGSANPLYAEDANTPDFFAYCNNAETTTVSTAYVRIPGKINGDSLDNTEKYLVLYDYSIGATGASTVADLSVMFGTTEIAQMAYEAADNYLPISSTGGGASGFYIVTGTAAVGDSLYSRFRNQGTTSTVYCGGRCLIALGLGHLTENTHYFQSVQNGATPVDTIAEVNPGIDTLLTVTWTLPDTPTDDWLILASGEFWMPVVGSGTSIRAELRIDPPNTDTLTNSANVPKERIFLEGEDLLDRQSWSFARILNFPGGGAHTLQIAFGNAFTGTSNVFGRRGRIVAISRDAYDQIVTVSNNQKDTVTVAYSTYENFVPSAGSSFDNVAFTPNQSEPLLVIANTWMLGGWSSGLTTEAAGLVRLRNDSQAVVWSDASSHSPRSQNAGSADSTRRGMITALGVKGDSANPTAWSIEVSADSIYDATRRPKLAYTDLIIWGLTETISAPASSPKRRRRLMNLSVRDEEIRPIEYVKQALGLSCDCPNDSLIVKR